MMSTLASCLNSSPDRCCDVPLPADANVSVPGFAFASAINSGTDFAGLFGGTISTLALVPISVIGTKLLTGSYGIVG